MFTWRVAEPRAAGTQQPARCMERDERGAARSWTHSPPARREGRGAGWPSALRCLGDRQAAGWLLYPVTEDPKRLTHSTEVCKPVLALLCVDQVVPALPAGRSLQHCFKQRV